MIRKFGERSTTRSIAQAIVERAFKGHGIAANGPAWPLHWAFDSAASNVTVRSGARRALLDSKLPSTQDNRRRVRPVGSVLVPYSGRISQLWERLALMVQRDLAEVGVDMQLESRPVRGIQPAHLATGDFDAVFMEFVVGNSASRPFTFWHSNELHEISGVISNPRSGSRARRHQARRQR